VEFAQRAIGLIIYIVPLAHRQRVTLRGAPLPKEPTVYQGDRASGLLQPEILRYAGHHASILALMESWVRSNQKMVAEIVVARRLPLRLSTCHSERAPVQAC